MMNNEQGGAKDWPMVPIFRRRKRPRQAFYAEPSDAFNSSKGKENDPKPFTNNSRPNVDQLKGSSEVLGLEIENICEDFDMPISNDFFGDVSPPKPSFNNTQNYRPYEASKEREKLPQQNSFRPMKMPSKDMNANNNRNLNFKSEEKNQASFVPQLAKTQRKDLNWEQRNEKQAQYHQQQNNNSIQSKEPKSQSTSNKRGPVVPRMLTTSSKDIKGIMQHGDMLPALYEIYGILDSAITSVPTKAAKRFNIRDTFGFIKCIFWEIDRSFPTIRRGSSVRCVGRIVDDLFQCLSIRNANQEEINGSKKKLMRSQDIMNQYIVMKSEY